MRQVIFLGMLAWSAPVFAVAAGGLGLTRVAAIVVGLCLAAFVATFASIALHRRIAGTVTRPVGIALVVATTLAIVRIATLSVFMADVNRIAYSVDPRDDFRRVHSCLSAYAESSRFSAEGGHNIYHRDLYRLNEGVRFIGPLRVDPFHYPPPFLLVPSAIYAIAPDFWDFRRLWFALQSLVLAGAIVGLAAWVGGAQGAVALLGGLLILAAPHAVATLQQGNFQLTAGPLAVVAIALLMAGRQVAGGTLVAYAALAKIFPGILVVPLLAGREWRRLTAVAAAAVILLALTLFVEGVRPFRDFVSTALPEISSGTAFPQTELTTHSRVNWSVYGETVRLRFLGVPWLTKPRGLMIVQLYGVAVVALAAWVGWSRRFDLSVRQDRLALIQVSLALVSLASFRSPFVGGIYGSVATLWLMGLAAAGAPSGKGQLAWLTSAVALAWATWAVPSPANVAPSWWLWVSGVLVAACIAINVWVAVRVAIAQRTHSPVERVAAVS